jgi:hypothetical protein
MWIGNVRNLPFEDQLRTTAAVGVDELSMTPLDFDRNICLWGELEAPAEGC